ncbi:hypothetical protein VP1G_03626 [Cytospora mali]|uniref:Uncharacterized protein n=1 Tax=Cytospora mali TaxID=578113 RepID=A0A194UX55_CYTMA|nr:hypothetical protein VP1G_03626 [Valsa mali var. pyri (nom. inval.)]
MPRLQMPLLRKFLLLRLELCTTVKPPRSRLPHRVRYQHPHQLVVPLCSSIQELGGGQYTMSFQFLRLEQGLVFLERDCEAGPRVRELGHGAFVSVENQSTAEIVNAASEVHAVSWEGLYILSKSILAVDVQDWNGLVVDEKLLGWFVCEEVWEMAKQVEDGLILSVHVHDGGPA